MCIRDRAHLHRRPPGGRTAAGWRRTGQRRRRARRRTAMGSDRGRRRGTAPRATLAAARPGRPNLAI
eukprot:354630-Alexandrium_andersonii.AAC.1